VVVDFLERQAGLRKDQGRARVGRYPLLRHRLLCQLGSRDPAFHQRHRHRHLAHPRTVDPFLAEFPEADFAANKEEALEAFRQRSLFNIVDYHTLWKIDFILRQHTPFDASRFRRREVVDIAGARLYTASAEDVVVTKLWWAKLGESDRQINDAVGILRVQGAALDLDYLERWVTVLELDEQWRAARGRLGEPFL
jgi:hypothetical protein